MTSDVVVAVVEGQTIEVNRTTPVWGFPGGEDGKVVPLDVYDPVLDGSGGRLQHGDVSISTPLRQEVLQLPYDGHLGLDLLGLVRLCGLDACRGRDGQLSPIVEREVGRPLGNGRGTMVVAGDGGRHARVLKGPELSCSAVVE